MIDADKVISPEEHLKRADHLVFVSLKISRTTDIIGNAVKRLIEAYELIFNEVLHELERRGKINSVPDTVKERAKLIKDLVGSGLNKYYREYNTLKKIAAADYEAFDEFRKNVTLRTKTRPPIDVKMDTVADFLNTTREAVKFLREWLDKG